jgi:hypothetical protein
VIGETERVPVIDAVDRLAADKAIEVTEIPPEHRLRTSGLKPFDHAEIEPPGLDETLNGVIRTEEATFAVVDLNLKNWEQGFVWKGDGERVWLEDADNFSYEGVDVLVELTNDGVAQVVGALAHDGKVVQVDRSSAEGSEKTGLHFRISIDTNDKAIISNYSNAPISVLTQAKDEYDGMDLSTMSPPKVDPSSLMEQSYWLVDPEQAKLAIAAATAKP